MISSAARVILNVSKFNVSENVANISWHMLTNDYEIMWAITEAVITELKDSTKSQARVYSKKGLYLGNGAR